MRIDTGLLSLVIPLFRFSAHQPTGRRALGTRVAQNLDRHHRGKWTFVSRTDLRMLAEQFSCLDQIRAQNNRHRDERAAYRRALRAIDLHPTITVHRDDDTDTWPDPQPPPETETLLDLPERELGAHPIDA